MSTAYHPHKTRRQIKVVSVEGYNSIYEHLCKITPLVEKDFFIRPNSTIIQPYAMQPKSHPSK